LRLVFVQRAAAHRRVGGTRWRELSLPRRIDPHAPGPSRAQGDDEERRLRSRRCSQPGRGRGRAARGDQVLTYGAAADPALAPLDASARLRWRRLWLPATLAAGLSGLANDAS